MNHLGTSKKVMANLNQFFKKLKPAQPINGMRRWAATAPDHLASIELIGPRNKIRKATVLLPMPADAPQIRTRNLFVLNWLIKNTFPAVSDPVAFIENVQTGITERGETQWNEKADGRELRVTWMPDQGFFTAAVEAVG